MTDLTKIDMSKFVGILVVGDIHSEFEPLHKAVDYARKHNLFIVFLGDLSDGGADPYATICLVHLVVRAGKGAFIIGNHDHKYVRLAAGKKVLLRSVHHKTLIECACDADDFLVKFAELAAHENSRYVHTFDRLIFAHGAVHRSLWDDIHNMTGKIRERALYGEVNGKRAKDDFPIRLYRWVDDIPSGYSTIVGHDRRPFGGDLLEENGPMVVRNHAGGKAFFIDTGCGKTKDGYLSGAVFAIDKGKLSFDRFLRF